MKVFISFVLLTVALAEAAPSLQADAVEEDGANMQYLFVEKSPGLYAIEDLIHSEIEARAADSDLTYHFFSRNDQTVGTDLKSNQLSLLKNTEFSGSKDTVFIIHGWMSNKETDLNYIIRSALFAKHDVNVFVVDWYPVASKNYITAKNSVVAVGKYVASFIRGLSSTYGVELSKVSCVGHSLGAHVCGGTGADLNGRLDHIVGLDPASPLFTMFNTDARLDPTDAQFVQVIHTNGGLLGFANSIGHADYYPNGGRTQPGCGSDVIGGCAHTRSYLYYAEAIRADSNAFKSKLCSSYTDYTHGRCISNPESVMGGYSIDKSARGDYYLDTNANALFAKL